MKNFDIRRAITGISICALTLVACTSASGYTRANYKEHGKPDKDLYVEGGRLAFEIERDGSFQITDGSDIAAIRAAMAAIRDVPTSKAEVVDAGSFDFPASVGAREGLVRDGKNRIYFFKQKDATMPAVALASVFYDASTGRITEADITLNEAEYNYSTATYGDPNARLGPNTLDIQEIVTHEMMHTLGFGHSAVAGKFNESTGLQTSGFHTRDFGGHATMYPYATGTIQGRTLSHDDVAGLSAAYPDAGPLCEISGTIVDGATGKALKGAHVVAVRRDDPSMPFAGTLSGIGQGLEPGQFRLSGLPQGEYYIRVEPLVGTSNPFGEEVTMYSRFDTNFRPEFYSGAVESAFDRDISMDDAHPIAVNTTSARTVEIRVVTNATPPRPVVSSAAFKNGKLKLSGSGFLVDMIEVEVGGQRIGGIKYPKKAVAANGVASKLVSKDASLSGMMNGGDVTVVVINTVTGERSAPVSVKR